MRRRSTVIRGRSVRVSVFVAVLLLCVGVWPRESFADELLVLRHEASASEPLQRQQLLAIYLGRITTWSDGTPITVFVLPDQHDVHKHFCRHVLGTYPYVLRAAWDRLVYTGTGFAPIKVRSEQEMVRRVAETPGAIGYVDSDQAPRASRFSAYSWR